ncbi:hypothetical protein cand_002100 [Cryptosporidium andersoni]|uniref:Uncharacterized protein n=1 Tax=Cryptosporidium andersoni TaxID=117008 RepID=A0A1J4MQB9_9CRYT|nr:hypothetical protein cand_002100 [Cryptosporidium andersoni]
MSILNLLSTILIGSLTLYGQVYSEYVTGNIVESQTITKSLYKGSINSENLIECTEGLLNWLLFSKDIISNILVNNIEDPEKFNSMVSYLTTQFQTVNESFEVCKDQLSRYGIIVQNKVSLSDIIQHHNSTINDTDKLSKDLTIEKYNELMEIKEQIHLVRNSLVNFNIGNYCDECKVFRAQLALINLVLRWNSKVENELKTIQTTIEPKKSDEETSKN